MAKTAIIVAVIDDEAPVRRALGRLLTVASFETETYGSAFEFIESLKHRIPHCAIVDLYMPEFSGIDLQRYLKASNPDIATVVITAFEEADIRERCMQLGAAAFLTKPLHGLTLIESVRAATMRPGPDL